jgi:hypothetical protein
MKGIKLHLTSKYSVARMDTQKCNTLHGTFTQLVGLIPKQGYGTVQIQTARIERIRIYMEN